MEVIIKICNVALQACFTGYYLDPLAIIPHLIQRRLAGYTIKCLSLVLSDGEIGHSLVKAYSTSSALTE